MALENEGVRNNPDPAETAPVQPLNIELSTKAEQEALFNGLTDRLRSLTHYEALYADKAPEEAKRESTIVRGIASKVARNLGLDKTMSVVDKINYGFVDMLSEQELEREANNESNPSAAFVMEAKYLLDRKREMNKAQEEPSK